MRVSEIAVIAEKECPIKVNGLGREAWIYGFVSGAVYKKARQERWKPVDIYRHGRFYAHATCLSDAGIKSGLHKSRVCLLMQLEKASRKGFTFKRVQNLDSEL